MHIWDVWNEVDYTGYREHLPRFAAEFGYQGPPTWATLTRAIEERPSRPDSAAMLLHQKAEDGNRKLQRGLAAHFPPVDGFDDWHWATSLNQARAVALGVEHLRSWSPRCAGAILWQLNDCWPVTSWAVVDGDGRRKPAWFALKHAYRSRLLTVQPRRAGLAAVAVNDDAAAWTGPLTVRRHDFAGAVLAEAEVALAARPRETVTITIPAEVARPRHPEGELLTVTDGVQRALWFYREDTVNALPEQQLRADVVRVDGGYRLDVIADTMVRDLALLVDRVDPAAAVDDMLVTLLPGESTSFAVRTTRDLATDQLTAPTVLRSANQLCWAPRS
jgi:beta-mannosidase